MIPVVRIVKSLRYSLHDMQGLTISDYELIEPINQAVSLLYGRLAEKYIHAAIKKKILIVDSSGSIELPSDFVRVHQVGLGDDGVCIPTSYKPTVEGTYRIMGTTFYAPEGAYGLEYYYIPMRVSNLGDDLDVPLSMTGYIEQMSLAMFNRDLATVEAIAQVVSQVLSDTEISHFENTGPKQILGGSV